MSPIIPKHKTSFDERAVFTDEFSKEPDESSFFQDKLKWIFLTFALAFAFPSVQAQTESVNTKRPYTAYYACDRILVRFQTGAPVPVKQDIIEALIPGAGFEETWRVGNSDYYFIPLPSTRAFSVDEVCHLLDRFQEKASLPPLIDAQPFLKSPGRNEWFGLTGKVAVKVNAEWSAELEQQLKRSGWFHFSKAPNIQGVYYFQQTASLFRGDALGFAAWLRSKSWVEWAEADMLFNPIVNTNDTYYHSQWALENTGQNGGTTGADLSIPEAWAFTQGDTSVIIGLLDSGVDTLHPDLVPNLMHGWDATGGNTNGYPSLSYSEDGHGTSCAGILAAVADNNLGIAGVCPQCRVLPVRVFYYQNLPLAGIQPWSTGTWMADAINFAVNAGADVLSNSWGIPDLLIPGLPGGSAIVETAILNATQNGRGGLGSPLLFSSGNDGGAPIWPGRHAAAISVNATSMCDERKSPASCDGQNWEGNWKDSLDVSAPGVDIYTTDMTGANGFTATDYTADFGGTSASAPFAAGVMALILSYNHSITFTQARAFLEQGCDKTGGYSYSQNKANGSWSQELGYGRINAYRSLFAVGREKGLEENAGFHVWPNPSSGTFRIQWDEAAGQDCLLKMRDSAGKLVYETLVTAGSNILNIDIRTGAGLYLLELESRGVIFTKKLMVLPQ